MKIQKETVKKILCIKLKGIGDVILSTVVLNNLRHDFPDAEIDFLTEPPSKNALVNIPLLNEIIIFDRNKKESALGLIWKIRRRKYDLIFDFYSNPRTALITFLSGARYRAGFPYQGRSFAYNLKGPAVRDKFHAADLHLNFLNILGLSSDNKELLFNLNKEEKLFAEEYFAENFAAGDVVFGLSPSGGWPSKKCDPVKFAEIGDALADRFGVKLLLLWGPGDKNEALEIRKKMQHKVKLAPLTDIRKMAALFSKCSLVVANDSGPMHMATALKVPVLSLHGPTNPRLQGPYGQMHEWIRLEELDCIECNLLECPRHHECFLDLPLERILAKVNDLIVKNNIYWGTNEKG